MSDSDGSHADQPESTVDEAALDEWVAFSEGMDEPVAKDRPHPLTLAAIVLAAVTLVGMVALRPTGQARTAAVEELSALGVPSEFYGADIVALERGECPGVPDSVCITAGFELTAGPDEGLVFEQAFPEGGTTPTLALGQSVVLSYLTPNAVVERAADGPCAFDAEQVCRTLTLAVTEPGLPLLVDYELFPGEIGGGLTVGDRAVATFFEADEGQFEVLSVSPVDPATQYQFADFQRRGSLLWLVIVFAAVVVALGRWRGAAALGGLAASVVVLLLFVLPAILDGRSPVLVAVFGAAAIAYLALYLAHGFSRMTTVALLGTLAALTLTAVLSAIAVGAAEFTGLVTEESSLLTLFDEIDVRGLLLAGIVLGSAGAIDDVTVTQASAVWELKGADPSMSPVDLFRRGLRIGRDHIASTVNTLLLAYAGAALPLLVLFVLSQQSLGTVANSEVVAVEIVRTLVGSIGLVAAVPLTTWLAAITAGPGRSHTSA